MTVHFRLSLLTTLTVIQHMLLLGILTLTDSSSWTFKFLHIVLRALHENVTIFAYLNRVVPNGRDGTLAIYSAAYLVALISTTPMQVVNVIPVFCN